ncbi:hypothetical protein BGX26_002216 [Mortierella sp. AD094]|nr:hypothetical protein BGX26_002216 [Mortierella sp. AD094]
MAYYIALMYLHGTRYLKPRQSMPFSTVLQDDVLPKYTPEKFQKIVCLTPQQVDILVELIQGSDHFKSKDPIRPQAPVKTQLMVTLCSLGTKGISTDKVAFAMGVGQGSVNLYTWCCIRAIEELERQFIVWPDQARKAEISSWFKT